MKKSTSYAPYIYAFLITVVSVLTQNSWYKPGVLFRSAVYFVVVVGMWRLIEWLLTRSDNKVMQWAYVLLGVNMYNGVYLSLDYYVFHGITTYSGLSPWDIGRNMFVIGVSATIFIESGKWTRAREKAKIDNLRLQAENIESKFKLLSEQVNPEFLFQCLTTLQTMSRSDAPQTEEYILKLADVYRQILKKQKDVVSLREELAFLQSYMFLMRYGREAALFFETDVFDESLGYQLPIFSLQSLADNCIKHHVFSESNPLYIHVFQEDAHSITMANNYPQKTGPLSINMENLEMRYTREGIENGVLVEKNESTYSTTLKLFQEIKN
jgi:two-component system, LytTR family, sensor kinase